MVAASGMKSELSRPVSIFSDIGSSRSGDVADHFDDRGDGRCARLGAAAAPDAARQPVPFFHIHRFPEEPVAQAVGRGFPEVMPPGNGGEAFQGAAVPRAVAFAGAKRQIHLVADIETDAGRTDLDARTTGETLFLPLFKGGMPPWPAGAPAGSRDRQAASARRERHVSVRSRLK